MSYSNFNIKKLEIYGNHVFEKNEIIRKIKNTVKEFLNSNKDIDYLVAYYYPTYKDMNNNIALCCLILDKDIKNIDLTYENFCQKLLWNEYYDFFSVSKKTKDVSYYNILNEANKMLQVVEEAYFILYELLTIVNYRNLSELNSRRECLERWLIRAEHINKFFSKLKPIINYDFICLIRHINDIFYYCHIPYQNQSTSAENNRQQIINNEITNAMDQFEVIHQQLTNFIGKHHAKEHHGDDIQFFSNKFFKEKGGKKYEKDYNSRR
jgi:hypothetical protein